MGSLNFWEVFKMSKDPFNPTPKEQLIEFLKDLWFMLKGIILVLVISPILFVCVLYVLKIFGFL